jgi:30S ribosomal protein S31
LLASKQVKNFQQNSDCCLNFLTPQRAGFYFLRHLLNKIFYMGRGDKKTKKGKTFKGSFGKSRPASKKKTTGNQPAVKKES